VSNVPVLFDINGFVGQSVTGGAEFPTVQERLAHMDRLGIGRALVWNVEARQDHALSANRRLLVDLRATPEAAGRIVPALAISGLMLYERDGLRLLKRQMQDGRTRALRFCNVFGRLTLRQLDPLIRSIRTLKPFLVMGHDEAPPADILEFTARFPDVPLILTQVMWGPCITVFDLMRQRRNILLETSWLHSYGAIELAVSRFGADRVVFGLGSRSHNGAAVAALARARISAAERRLIAHGNLERLTGLKPAARRGGAGGEAPDTLWQRLLAGRPLDVDVVDAHAHIGPSAGYLLEAQDEVSQVRLALRDMDALGIRTMIASGLQALLGQPAAGNDLLAEVAGGHAGRLAGYVGFNPFYADELMAQVDRYVANPFFVGFKLLCGYWRVPITDRRFDPMWRYANRRRLPVLMHTWSGSYDSPAMLAKLVRRFPQVSFIVGHSGGSDEGRREAEALALANRNVYLEWCGSFCSTIRWEDTLQRVNPRQVVFGTDAMVHDIHWELGRLLSVDASEAVLTAIVGRNMRRILARRRG
jgi:predicted TIM-barrel fold metal-dependent hydrolase